MRLRRRLLWIVAPALGLLTVASAVLAARSARNTLAWCHPARKIIRPEDRAAALAAAPTLEDVSFRTSDGLTLRGWYVPAKNRAAIVLVHGGYDNRTQWLAELRILSERGYGALVYDSRASGESDGDLVTAGDREQRDVTAALDFVSARSDVDPARIGIIGFSFGAHSVSMVAARDPRARAVMLQAVWTSLEDEARDKTRRYGPITAEPAVWALRHEGVNLDNVRPIDNVARIQPRPIFFLIGSADTDTPVPVVERVFAKAGAPKEMWIVPGAHHGDYAAVAKDEYARRLLAFFDAALGT
jgi:dipeptidyl aminopeptidase/acylaminoacyl peptidase